MQETAPNEGSGAHIILVDDDDAVARLASRLLERLGHEVEVFTRAEDALERISSAGDPFDAIITDYRMPGMTGAQLLHAVREAGVVIPALVVSGFADEIDQDALREMGVGPVLEKPFTKAEMHRRLTEILSGEFRPA